VVLGGTTGWVQQPQGNASRASTAGRYLEPISPLVNNYFNQLLNYKNLVLIDEEKKRGKGKVKWWKQKNRIGGLDLVYGFFWKKWTVTTNLDNDGFRIANDIDGWRRYRQNLYTWLTIRFQNS
jgi:hypothetical protein